MAGGVGTRLWPLSRNATPKQFQKLTGDISLFQQAFRRLHKLLDVEHIWVMTGESYGQTIRQQVPEFLPENIITEPSARNTAPASALAIMTVLERDPFADIAIVASDHHIGKEDVFASVMDAGYQFVSQKPDYVLAIGIHPTTPNTGYGYIKIKEPFTEINGRTVYSVDSFHEKPDLKTATKYLKSGQYLWNGSYFIFNGSQMLANFKKFSPELVASIEAYIQNPSADRYQQIPSSQLDKTIIEKLNKMAAIQAEMEWSDVGDWAALHEILNSKGEETKALMANHIGNNSENTLVVGGNKLIATVGLKDIVIIDTDDVLLVCHKDSVQDVKKVVEQLKEQQKEHYL